MTRTRARPRALLLFLAIAWGLPVRLTTADPSTVEKIMGLLKAHESAGRKRPSGTRFRALRQHSIAGNTGAILPSFSGTSSSTPASQPGPYSPGLSSSNNPENVEEIPEGECGGLDGPEPVAEGGGCCPMEGFQDGDDCNGHGTCEINNDISANVNDINALGGGTATSYRINKQAQATAPNFKPKSATKPKKTANPRTIKLTEEEQESSLGENYAEYVAMVNSTKESETCDLEVKEQISTDNNPCILGESFGCVDRPGENAIYTKNGCKGTFVSKAVPNNVMACASNGAYAECDTLQGATCEVGQGEEQGSMLVFSEVVVISSLIAPSLTGCSQLCGNTDGCVAFDFASGLKISHPEKVNCRLYNPNEPRFGEEGDDGELWEYCTQPPGRRYGACGANGICAKCVCETGWSGITCEIAVDDPECAPMDLSCQPPMARPEPPCFGQPEEFPEDHPCRDPFREHVPNPPVEEPEFTEELSYQAMQDPAKWSPPGEEGE